jgi:hypothetical protein
VVFKTNSTTGTPSNVDYRQDITSSAVVQTASLGQVMSDHDIGRMDFLKVDTDGYEVEVFSGARDVITRDTPLIFTEFGPTSLRRLHSEVVFFDLLVSLGCIRFLVFQHSGEFLGVATTLDQIMRLKADDYYVDLVCTPPGRFTAALERWT